MSRVAITKVTDDTRTLPIFAEVAKRLEAVKERAFELFEKRDRKIGNDIDDWLRAERELLGWPATELVEKNGAYEMQITLPGFDAKEVEITAAPTEIIVHAATEHEHETQKGKVLWSEFGSNDVYRRFETPNPIDVEKVHATFENGLLRISAPEMTNAIASTAGAGA